MTLDRYLIMLSDGSWTIRMNAEILDTCQGKAGADCAAAIMSRHKDGAFVSLWTFGPASASAETQYRS